MTVRLRHNHTVRLRHNNTVRLRHNKVELALHELRGGDGRALLLLHGLGENTPEAIPSVATSWPGPVFGLDFTGHGESAMPRGGGYTSEILMADADAALARVGSATLLGRGLGAYVALLLAGGRPTKVRGAVLVDGPGIHGGGDFPGSPVIAYPGPQSGPPDPYALVELGRDIRPADYATSFARQATHLSGLPSPITVAAVVRPPWLEAIVAEPGVVELPADQALAMYAEVQ